MKDCRNCINYRPASFRDAFQQHYYARCAILIGANNDNHFCDIARTYEHLCGPEADYFIAKGDVYAWHSVAQLLESSHGQA